MAIKAIIFDLGGVIVDLDFSKFYNEIILQSPLNKPQTPIMLEFFRQSDTYHQGKISDDEFYNLACDLLQVCALEKKEFFNAFNSIIDNISEEMVELIKGLKNSNKIKILCLSNINSSHWNHLKIQNLGLFKLFDDVLLSHQLKMTKPDPKIFKYAIKKARCKPKEIVFVDDGLNNIKSAKRLGIIGIHFTTIEHLKNEFKKLNIVLN